MQLTAQLTRFGVIGSLAALCHVSVAVAANMALQRAGAASPEMTANLIGFCTATLVSYFGHARLTFAVTPDHGRHLPRFVAVALAGLATSSLITHVVCTELRGQFAVAMVAVICSVPALSFLLMRLWAFSPLTGGTSRARGSDERFGFLLCCLAATAFLTLFLGRTVNHDTAWYLLATREWLAGKRLYIDISEVNPPLNFYLTAPVIWLADLTGLADPQAQVVTVAMLMFGSLVWCWNLLGQTTALSLPRRSVLLAGTAFAMTAPALSEVAQREHLLMILLMPWLLGQLLPDGADRRGQEMGRAACAMVGICLKPYFLLFPIFVTLWRMAVRHSLRPVISAGNLTMVALGAAYVVFVWLVHPAYLSDVVPTARLIYDGYQLSPFTVLVSMNPLLALPLFFALAPIALRRLDAPGANLFATAAMAGFCIYWVQAKGFNYQAIPWSAMVTLTCFWTVCHARRLALAAVPTAVSAALILFPPLLTRGFYDSPSQDRLIAMLAGDHHDRIAVLSADVAVGPPVALALNAVWTLRGPSIWYVPGVVDGLASTACTAKVRRCAKLRLLGTRARSEIVADIQAGAPDVIVLDKHDMFIRAPGFTWQQFMSSEPGFAAYLSKYRLAATTARFDVFARSE